MRIPFNKPPYIGKESEYVFDAVNKGHISGDGEYTKKCAKSKKSLAEQSEHFLLHHVLMLQRWRPFYQM